MDFEGEDYLKLVGLRDKLVASGESHQFYRNAPELDARSFIPKTAHYTFPRRDDPRDNRYWERTLVTLSLWEEEQRGEVRFVTPSGEAFKKAVDAVRKLIAEPTRKTRSGVETFCLLAE